MQWPRASPAIDSRRQMQLQLPQTFRHEFQKSIAENSSTAMKAAMATVFPQLPITEAHIDLSLHLLIRSAYIVMLRLL
jgi:hypothetical protein